MQMTSARLKQIREERSMTLREMAEFLRDVDGSTLSRWERNPDAEIPQWIAERLLTSVPITLPLEELEEMLEVARAEGLSFSAMLATAIREYLAAHGPPGNIVPYQLDPAAEADKTTLRVADDSIPHPPSK